MTLFTQRSIEPGLTAVYKYKKFLKSPYNNGIEP